MIEGDLLDTADPGQVRAAGAVLARLQGGLAAYPAADRIPALAVASKPLTERVAGWLDARAEYLPAAARDTLCGLVAGASPDRLPRQLVHFDFRSANLSCAGGEFTAVIDFEAARHDHQLVELARAAVLLGTRYHNWGPVPAEVRTEFLVGYQAVRPVTPAEAGWLDIPLLWQSLAMVPPGDDPTGWGPSALSKLPRLIGDRIPCAASARSKALTPPTGRRSHRRFSESSSFPDGKVRNRRAAWMWRGDDRRCMGTGRCGRWAA